MENKYVTDVEPGYLASKALYAPDPERKWFALSVNVRHEKIVSQLLLNKGFETFLPLHTRRHQYDRRVRTFDLPLFPGYLFCRVNPTARLPVLTTPGVLRMIGAGRVPIPLEDDEIVSLQRVAEAGIAMVPHPFWRSGQTGRVTAGPLTGIEGIVVGAKQSMRLVLSVSLLQRSVLLEIDSDCVALA
ncbi:MAG: transcriptional activator RfaH [Bryobacterales bacterium]|jgi:transcription antitermination factor NusG|nr:transcriptional activator RfaH [Bryobacterales bacterium]